MLYISCCTYYLKSMNVTRRIQIRNNFVNSKLKKEIISSRVICSSHLYFVEPIFLYKLIEATRRSIFHVDKKNIFENKKFIRVFNT